MLPLLFLALPAVAYAQVPCASFWPGVGPGKYTLDTQCYIYPGEPETLGGVRYTFAYDVAWANKPDNVESVDSLARVVHNAMQTIIPAYEAYQNTIPEIVFILTTLSMKEEQASASRPLDENGPCQVLLSSGFFETSAEKDDTRMQVIAHEVYHCAQSESTFFGPHFDAPNWVIESSADYFSNVVFPAVNDEWHSDIKYRCQVPIFDNDPYSGNIFLQSLEQAYGPAFINQWVKDAATLSSTATAPSERSRLSGLSTFGDDWHNFGRQYSTNSIRDSNGEYVPGFPQVIDPVALTPGGDDDTATIHLSATTFTVNQYTFDLDSGQTASITYSSGSSNVKVSYMLQGGDAWIDMPGSAASVSAEGTIVAHCKGDESTSQPVLILLTATEDATTVDVDIVVKQVSEDENCTCKGSNKSGQRRRGLNRCNKKKPPKDNDTGSKLCKAVEGQPKSDPCLDGKDWKLDNDAMETYIRSKLNEVSSVNIKSLSISGSGILSIDGTNATFSYSNFEIDLDIEAAGLDIPTKTVLNGEFDSNLYLQDSNIFCLDVYAGQGTAVETDDLTGGFSFDLGPDGGFVEDSYRIDYECSAGSLTMQMSMGSQSWGPYVYSS
ncbi:hypothetical protein B0T10DRAFT_52100 [Thelonectria olida]|uniref:Uncharacterized protein n=1 Tax=Thelonectria olida TaxID=1576542 RepID=A0A9P9ALW2_9HYPO|nr:hypothetical protein B0T10DRAFT_52100 [Thelonectria olida]